MEKYFSKVPYLNKDIYCSEISVQQYKVILKSLFTDTLSDVFVKNTNNLLTKITNLNEEEISNLNFIEYFILLIFVRNISMGNDLKLIFTFNNIKTNVSVNLSNTIKNFIPALILKEKKLNINNIEFVLSLPSINKFILQHDILTDFYIKQATVNNITIYKQKDLNVLINTLTPLNFKILIDECKQYNKQITDLYFYNNIKKEFCINFIPHPDNVLYYLKLVFNDDLQTLYNDIHYLSKIENLTTDYLINCTPGEFKLHAKILEAAVKEKETPPSDTWDLDKSPKQ
jgi:hypothetical protein